MGQVRQVLWQHLWQAGQRQGVPAPDGDPNDLIDAEDFAHAILQHGDETAQRQAGRAYAQLWARTFRTLTRHARGEPERLLTLFVEEVYPYLRGVRLAARLERLGPRRTRMVLQDDLPAAYLAGLVEGFVALSGAQVEATPGYGHLTIRHRLSAADQAARLVRHIARLRIPLLLTSLLAACVGVAASGLVTSSPWPDLLAVLVGTLAAQSGANALHDLHRGQPHHALGPQRLGRPWLWFQTTGSYALAAACLLWLLPGRPGLWLFAGAGFLLGRSYASAKDAGKGPLMAALTHGPLIVWGSLYALAGPGPWATPGPVLLLAVPTAALGAAILYLDDMADRPLDQAAGSRTLVVRLPLRRHVPTFTALLAAGLAPVAILAVWSGRPVAILACLLLVALAAIVQAGVRRHADDPAGLAWPRAQLLALYACSAASFALLLLRFP